MLVGLPCQAATGTVVVKHKKIVELQNSSVGGYGCTATVGMIMVGNDLYCIRTFGKDIGKKLPITLHKISNFRGTNQTYSQVVVQTNDGSAEVAVHANSLTYADGYFYVATMNTQSDSDRVIAFTKDGKIVKSYQYDNKITAINYYDTVKDSNGNRKKRFLVCVGHNVEKDYYRYHLVSIKGNRFQYENVQFKVSGMNTFANITSSINYKRGNDCYYDADTKMFYITMFKDKNNTIKENVILQYDLSKGISGEKTMYDPVRVYEVDADGEAKFEVEGMLIYGGKKYVCTNANEAPGIEGQDSVYVLYK